MDESRDPGSGPQTETTSSQDSPLPLILQRSVTQLEAGPEPLDPHTEPMGALPLMGRVSAGRPFEAIEDPDWVQVPARLTRNAQYALRVRGDSMTDDQIQDDDLILVQSRQHADNGEIVIALIDGEDATVKRLYREPHSIRLQPANAALPPLRYQPERVRILGVVTAVLRYAPIR